MNSDIPVATRTGMIVGMPSYMSREQARGADAIRTLMKVVEEKPVKPRVVNPRRGPWVRRSGR